MYEEDAAHFTNLTRTRDATENPVAALGRFVKLRKLADNEIAAAVYAARGVGVSWTEIGGSLGVTRQAAWKQFHSRARPGEARRT